MLLDIKNISHAINSRFVRFINMSNNTLKYLFAVILPLIVGQLFVSCKHGNPMVDVSLDRIEQVVQQRPDSALIELVRLDSLLDAGAVSIEGDRQMARYALLKTQTHDKNYIDDSNDSLIMRAVRYYDDHGSKRERMLAHFYHGAIRRNANDYSLAFTSYMMATALAQSIPDTRYQSMGFLNLSIICNQLGSFDAVGYADSAYYGFKAIGDTVRMAWSLVYKAKALSYYKRIDEATELFETVLSMTDDSLVINACLRQYIDQCVRTGEYEKASELFSRFSSPYYFSDYSNRVYVDVYRGNTVQAWQDIRLAKDLIRNDNDSTFYYTALRNVYLLASDYQNAYQALARKSALQDSIVRAMFSHSVASVQKEYLNQQYEHVRYVAEQRKQKWFFSSIFFLLFIAFGVAYILKKRKEHQHIIETYMENVSDMQRTLLENTDAIATLQHKAEAMDSERLAKEETYRNQIKTLFAKSFHELESLYKKYYQFQNEQGIQREIYKDVCDRINAFAQATQQEELDHLIDENFDHAMEKVKSPEFELSDKELQLYKYKVAGLSARTIRMLMHIESQDALQKRQQRLRKKILESNSPFATELASLMG